MTTTAETYRLAQETVLSSYPKWKRDAINDDRLNGNLDTGIMTELVKDIESKINDWDNHTSAPPATKPKVNIQKDEFEVRPPETYGVN